MGNRGKWVAAIIVAVASVAAGVAWWYTYRQGQRVLRLWGAESARRIRLAPDVELWVLEPADSGTANGPNGARPAGESDAGGQRHLVVGTRRWTIVRRIRLDQAPGFLHARQALIVDPSFRWHQPLPQPAEGQWEFALQFRDTTGETVLVFDLQHALVLSLHDARAADIQPIAAGLERFFAEQSGLPRAR